MKKIRMIMASVCAMMTLSTYSNAAITIDACVKSHPPGTNCYELFITITDVLDGMSIYIASGTVWVGDNCPPQQKMLLPSPNPLCANFLIDNQAFLTDNGSPCLQGVFSNPANYALYEAARDAIINQGSNSLLRTSKETVVPIDVLNTKSIMKIYPNPSSTKNIIVSTKFDNKESNLELRIYDLVGKVVYNLDLKSKENTETKVDLSNLTSGTYQAILFNANKVVNSQKIVLQ